MDQKKQTHALYLWSIASVVCVVSHSTFAVFANSGSSEIWKKNTPAEISEKATTSQVLQKNTVPCSAWEIPGKKNTTQDLLLALGANNKKPASSDVDQPEKKNITVCAEALCKPNAHIVKTLQKNTVPCSAWEIPGKKNTTQDLLNNPWYFMNKNRPYLTYEGQQKINFDRQNSLIEDRFSEFFAMADTPAPNAIDGGLRTQLEALFLHFLATKDNSPVALFSENEYLKIWQTLNHHPKTIMSTLLWNMDCSEWSYLIQTMADILKVPTLAPDLVRFAHGISFNDETVNPMNWDNDMALNLPDVNQRYQAIATLFLFLCTIRHLGADIPEASNMLDLIRKDTSADAKVVLNNFISRFQNNEREMLDTQPFVDLFYEPQYRVTPLSSAQNLCSTGTCLLRKKNAVGNTSVVPHC